MSLVWCGQHRGYVPEHEAQIIGGTETGSGPGLPAYACIACIRDHGLVPRRNAYVGRPDAAPIAPVAGLDSPQPPRVCARCGRTTTAYTLHEPGADHGPLDVAWCTDPVGCVETQAALQAGYRIRP